MKPISRIIFTGDFMRPSPTAFRPTQHENIRWLAYLLGVPVSMATGLPCETVLWDDNWVNQAPFERETIASIYRCMWAEPSIHGWAQVYSSGSLPGSVELLFNRVFAESFVISFEMPPALAIFFNRAGIDYIDCSLSPIRFMDDLVMSVNGSKSSVIEVIQGYRVPEALQRLMAGIVSSHAAKGFTAPPLPNTLLIIMQTRYDRALIEGGGFAKLENYLDELRAVAMDYSHILIKQHPLEGQTKVRDFLLRNLPNAHETNENFYRLISHPNLTGVAALSSSCVYEAGFFGKRQHMLMPCAALGIAQAGAGSIDVGDAVMAPDFWRDVFSATGLSVSPKDGLRLPLKPSRLRFQLRSAWGYNQIDTDIAASWAKK